MIGGITLMAAIAPRGGVDVSLVSVQPIAIIAETDGQKQCQGSSRNRQGADNDHDHVCDDKNLYLTAPACPYAASCSLVWWKCLGRMVVSSGTVATFAELWLICALFACRSAVL